MPLDPIPSSAELRPVKLATIGHDKQGQRLANVGVFAWGRFDENDQINIAHSFEDTVEAAIGNRRPSGQPVNVHIMIRTYMLVFSNRDGATIAGVDWCAADSNSRVLFQDTFYAAHYCGRFPDICTLGMNKDVVHEAIVKRIAQDALAIATGGKPAERKVERTHAHFEAAAAVVPKTMGQPGEYLPKGLSGNYDIGPVRVLTERAKMGEPIDWKSRLAGMEQPKPGIEQPKPAVQEDHVNCLVNGERIWTYRSRCD